MTLIDLIRRLADVRAAAATCQCDATRASLERLAERLLAALDARIREDEAA